MKIKRIVQYVYNKQTGGRRNDALLQTSRARAGNNFPNAKIVARASITMI